VTEQELYDGIAQQDNRVFLYLYENFQGKILGMVQQNSGDEAEAMDVFQEGLVALWTNINKGTFTLKENARITTYLYALCRNIWISRLRKRKITQPLESDERIEIPDDTDALEAEHDRIQELGRQLDKLGEACQQLLRLYYYEKKAMQEIAEQLGLTPKTAKNNKYRCMQRLRALYQN
jgi:RNA polymerase sigma factor (sigma-70 family)